MKNKASIVTKSGDAGLTQILYGKLVKKTSIQIGTLGEIDEVIAWIGKAREISVKSKINCDIELRKTQRVLMNISASVAVPCCTTSEIWIRKWAKNTHFNQSIAQELEHIEQLINQIETFDQNDWRYPGDKNTNCDIEILVRITRRAERGIWLFIDSITKENSSIDRTIYREHLQLCAIYINRLSDFFYLLGNANLS